MTSRFVSSFAKTQNVTVDDGLRPEVHGLAVGYIAELVCAEKRVSCCD